MPKADRNRKILYKKAADYLNQVLDAARNKRGFSLQPGFKIVSRMVEMQPLNDPLFISAIHHDNPDEFIVYHSVNVSIFSIKMAQHLGFGLDKQVEIGIAGLLHDVGMAFVPNHIIFKQNKLNPKELHLLKERPKNSYKILKPFGDAYAYLAESAAQVYERIDGSGYPNGLKGDDIHEYAQIIGLLAVYDALIHSRPQREKFLHFNAVKEIIKTGKKGFQRKYLKALLNIFSIFPLSSHVRLNSNAIGQVIETYPEYPMRPKIQIMYDSQNQRVLTERIVNLSKESLLLYIVDAVSDHELSALSKG
jgi:HD-GYP domain-containing protein (c-di-GMP phosphodiesterase class II)